MLIKNISPELIINTAGRHNKDYEIEFINTDTSKDTYILKVFLRYADNQYKIRLILTSSILAYPALDLVWEFQEKEYDLASRVFHRICDEADYLKIHTDEESTPLQTLSAMIKESVKPISVSHQKITNIPSIDESFREQGESDWRKSLYGNRYPDKQKPNMDKYFQPTEVTNIYVNPSRRNGNR